MQEIIARINTLREEKNAVILAHNYQLPEVQDIADYVGDSLGLSQQAAATNADVIVFCGVHFMAETAKILSPQKTVVMPDVGAGCPMANMITADKLRALKAEHPGAIVVCYVNTTADVKAECDIACTSANADKVVNTIPRDKEIIFVPDKYLGSWVMKQTGRQMILWDGFCPTHKKITAETVLEAKAKHPGALVVAHPECLPEVSEMADVVKSTSGIISFVKHNPAEEFIIGTEVGIIHRLQKENPEKRFYPATDKAVCPNMKKTTLEKVLWILEDLSPEITVPDDIAEKARRSIDRMLENV